MNTDLVAAQNAIGTLFTTYPDVIVLMLAVSFAITGIGLIVGLFRQSRR